MNTSLLLPRGVMLRAFTRKDPTYEGTFVVAVKTTGIFCRPTCRAKQPRPENVEFFATTEEAQRHGYRACKLCRPLDPSRRPAIVEHLMRVVDQTPQGVVRERDLRTLGVDPATARRLFRRHTGMTFAAYQRSHRVGGAIRAVNHGSAVIQAQSAAGFGSGSGFREAVTRLFGVAPSDARAANLLASRWIETPLGDMLAVANDDGLLLLDFHDRKGLPRAIERLRKRCGTRGRPAIIVPAPARLATAAAHDHLAHVERELRDYFAGRLQRFGVKTAPRGSVFEQRVWEVLRSIPYGTTRSYAQQAQVLGAPSAVRAVARANGMNYISIVIPCHRVIGANGALVGYGGGLARKRWLLEHERRVAAQ